MDSMRHLSTSLPTRRTEQPQELLSAFKAAALSVTNLYKTSASAQDRARIGGYQDALDDLLAFLDREHLGLGDGEGWRVRQWATERLDDGVQRQPISDDDDDENTKRDPAAGTRSSSPDNSRKPAVASSEPSEEPATQRRTSSEPPQRQHPSPQGQPAPTIEILPLMSVPSLHDFSFRSSQPYPRNHDPDASNGMEVDHNPSPSPANPGSIARPGPRSSRQRHTRTRGGGDVARPSTVNINFGAGAGNKRKMPFGEFFDIPEFHDERRHGYHHDRKEGGGKAGKKSRPA